jgi:hypothetical protein
MCSEALSFAGSIAIHSDGEEEGESATGDEFSLSEDDDFDAVLQALTKQEEDEIFSSSSSSPEALSYSSSDETSSVNTPTVEKTNSFDSVVNQKETKRSSKRTSKTTKDAVGNDTPSPSSSISGTRGSNRRQSQGLSAQEKRDLRKLRNRELAAESRKRKNDEMERLRQENQELKQRIVELERKLNVSSSSSLGSSSNQVSKRTRVGSTLATSVAVASLAVFVVTVPAGEHEGLMSSTASVLITALDSIDSRISIAGHNVTVGQALMTVLLATLMLMVFATVSLRFVKSSVASLPFSSRWACLFNNTLSLPKRMNSLTSISNAV